MIPYGFKILKKKSHWQSKYRPRSALIIQISMPLISINFIIKIRAKIKIFFIAAHKLHIHWKKLTERFCTLMSEFAHQWTNTFKVSENPHSWIKTLIFKIIFHGKKLVENFQVCFRFLFQPIPTYSVSIFFCL